MIQKIQQKTETSTGYKFMIHTGKPVADMDYLWVSKEDFDRFKVGDAIAITISLAKAEVVA